MEDVTQWLATIPAWLLFTGFALFAVALTLGIDLVLRRRVEERTRSQAGRTAAIMLGVLANIYAVLIAFVVVQGWNDLQVAQTYVDGQASALTQIRQNSVILHDGEERRIDDALDRYARSVIRYDFPSMEKDGRRSPRTTAALEGLFRTVRDATPNGRSQEAFYDQTVVQLDRLVQARQSSVTASDGSLPLPLYILLGLGGVAIVGLACTLDSEHRRSHLFVVCSIAVVISFMLALVVSFDHPFSGSISVTDRPIRVFLTFPAPP
jgi:hypothetical protein